MLKAGEIDVVPLALRAKSSTRDDRQRERVTHVLRHTLPLFIGMEPRPAAASAGQAAATDPMSAQPATDYRSRSARLRSALRARLIAAARSRARFSDGFS